MMFENLKSDNSAKLNSHNQISL